MKPENSEMTLGPFLATWVAVVLSCGFIATVYLSWLPHQCSPARLVAPKSPIIGTSDGIKGNKSGQQTNGGIASSPTPSGKPWGALFQRSKNNEVAAIMTFTSFMVPEKWQRYIERKLEDYSEEQWLMEIQRIMLASDIAEEEGEQEAMVTEVEGE